jgi:hypothetical protein
MEDIDYSKTNLDTADIKAISKYFRLHPKEWSKKSDDYIAAAIDSTDFYQYFSMDEVDGFLYQLSELRYSKSIIAILYKMPNFVYSNSLYREAIITDNTTIMEVLKKHGCALSKTYYTSVYKIPRSRLPNVMNNLVDGLTERDDINLLLVKISNSLIDQDLILLSIKYQEIGYAEDMDPLPLWAADNYMNSIVERCLPLLKTSRKCSLYPSLRQAYSSNFIEKRAFGKFQTSTFAKIIRGCLFKVSLLPIPLEARLCCLPEDVKPYIDRSSLTKIFNC